MKERFLRGAATLILGIEGFFARHSRIAEKTFYDPRDFPWAASIEAGWAGVRSELDALLPYAKHFPNFQDLSRMAAIGDDDGWKTYFFYAFGLPAIANCRRCPKTKALLKRIPGMKTAFFSVLAPGKHLPPHRGFYKGVLRLHLALLIPEPAETSGIRVGDETRHWQEGKVMIFDDTFEHEAWNRSDRMRIVLFVDFVRPMRFPANLVNATLTWIIAMSPLVLGAAGSYLRWERRFEDIVEQGADGDRAQLSGSRSR